MPEGESGLHRHTHRIKDEYPEPLSWLLVEMAERNREEWLGPDNPKRRTYGAEQVRETGLTSNQQEWAQEIATKLEQRDDWACEECGQNKSTATRGGNGKSLCNDCLFGGEDSA